MDGYYPVYKKFSPISVEAGTNSYGLYYAPDGSTYIRIGLGSQEAGLDEMDINVTLGSEAEKIAGRAQVLGSLYVGGLSVKSNGSSYVTLYKQEGQMGLGVNVDVELDKIRLNTLSWGDADGIGDNTKAGFVGLKNTDISGITVTGPVSMEVRTDDKGELALTKFIRMDIGYDHLRNPAPLEVGIASLDTTVVVGDKKDFSGRQDVLGELYMKDLQMNVRGYLDIYNPQDKAVATNLDFGLTIPSLTLDTLAWGDPDGIPEHPNMGGVGLRDLAISNLAIEGRATIGTETEADDTGLNLFPLGKTFVHIGLNSLNVSMDSLDTDVALGNRKDNLNQVLGSVYIGGLKTSMSGSVDIHTPSASTQGIVLELDASFPTLTMNALSWGDKDGLGIGTPDPVTGITPAAGYVGLRDLAIDNLKVAGRVSIDVATVDPTVPVNLSDMVIFYATAARSQMSPTFVHIGLGTGDANISPSAANGQLFIGIAKLRTDVVLDKDKTLASNSRGILGSFYMQDLSVGINGWVDIGSHGSQSQVVTIDWTKGFPVQTTSWGTSPH